MEDGGGYGRRRRKVVGNPVSPKPTPPKAPTTYWGDPKEEKGAENGKGGDSKGKDAEGEDSKGKDPKGKDAKGTDSKGGKGSAKVEEDLESARSSY